ncbi:hypothetical protein D3C87_1981380 [compost metagenome]
MTYEYDAAVGTHVQQLNHFAKCFLRWVADDRLIGIEFDIAEQRFAFVFRQVVFDSVTDDFVDIQCNPTT